MDFGISNQNLRTGVLPKSLEGRARCPQRAAVLSHTASLFGFCGIRRRAVFSAPERWGFAPFRQRARTTARTVSRFSSSSHRAGVGRRQVIRNSALAVFLAVQGSSLSAQVEPVFPGEHWEFRQPESVGLSQAKLDALRDPVGGRGCVVRYGYVAYSWGDPARSADIASAVKPVISTLLFFAVQEGKLTSVDAPVSEFEPRLKTLNQGKDVSITWRHFASQTSGYGLSEPPGVAYAYNDFALALYYDTLTQKVFTTNGTEVLRSRLAEPLKFEDHYSFSPFRRPDRDGRLAISTRDLARFGLLYLRQGKWRGQQLLQTNFVRMALHSPVLPNTPRTGGNEAEMLPGQRTLGGTRNITGAGPGYYSFNWWLNGTNSAGRRLFAHAPPDAYAAAGHGGIRVLFIVPSLELIVCWNDGQIEDFDESPGNPNTRMNQATHLACEAVTGP